MKIIHLKTEFWCFAVIMKRKPLRGIAFKDNPAQLFFIEYPIGHLQDVLGRNSLHVADDVVHVFDRLTHKEGTCGTQQLVHAALITQGHLSDELLLGVMQLQGA